MHKQKQKEIERKYVQHTKNVISFARYTRRLTIEPERERKKGLKI